LWQFERACGSAKDDAASDAIHIRRRCQSMTIQVVKSLYKSQILLHYPAIANQLASWIA